jgi:hypothetical protein
MRGPYTQEPGGIDLTSVVADAAESLRRRFAAVQPAPDRTAEKGEDDPAENLVARLCELALAWPGDEPTRRRLVLGAVTHGMLRREQEQSETVIFQDYDDLRARIWDRVRRSGLRPAVAADVILSLDAAIGLGIAASLRGFHREVLSRSRDWGLVIDRLVWDWRIQRDVQDET